MAQWFLLNTAYPAKPIPNFKYYELKYTNFKASRLRTVVPIPYGLDGHSTAFNRSGSVVLHDCYRTPKRTGTIADG